MRNFFKTTLISTALILTASAMAIPSPQASQSINKIVAIVNNTPITQVQVNQMINSAPPAQAPTEQMALTALINQTLQLAVAKRLGITVSDSDVNNAITNIAKQNHMTVMQMKAKVTQNMSWSAYKKQIQQQMILTKVQQQAVQGKVSVTRKSVDDFLKAHGDQLGLQTKYQYSDLLIPVTAKVNQAKAVAYAKQVDSAWKPGVNLSTLSQKLPETVNASMLLDQQWQTPDNIPDVFIAKLNTLSKGHLSAPIITGNGVHVLQLDNKIIPSQHDAQQKAIEILSQQAFLKAVKNWVKTLRTTSYVKVMPTASS